MSTVRRHAAGEGKPSVRVYDMGVTEWMWGFALLIGPAMTAPSVRRWPAGVVNPRHSNECDSPSPANPLRHNGRNTPGTGTHCDTTVVTRRGVPTNATQSPRTSHKAAAPNHPLRHNGRDTPKHPNPVRHNGRNTPGCPNQCDTKTTNQPQGCGTQPPIATQRS